MSNERMIFVNLAVGELARSTEFFTKLGFSLEPRFCDDKASCVVISENHVYVMLLAQPFFQTFTKKAPCDTRRYTEGMFALSCSSRQEVDELVHKALEAGGTHAMDPIDHGFMYGWSFYDLDGHHWEVLWMDPNAPEGQAGEATCSHSLESRS